MITVHDAFDTNIEPTNLGLGVIFPDSCTVIEEAGGNYSMNLTHPLDEGGAWKLLQPFNIICAPVPVCETPMVSASEGEIIDEGLEVWRALEGGAGYYKNTIITRYPAYQYPHLYGAGDKMRYNNINYICLASHAAAPSPRFDGGYWKSQGNGTPKPAWKLDAGTQVTVSDNDGTWLTVRLQDGTKGYCKVAEMEYMYTAEPGSILPGDVDARTIAQQLFRITDVEIDAGSEKVSCSAQHISYDWSMVLVDSLIVDETPVTTAAVGLRSAILKEEGEDSPNVYVQETGNPVTGTYRRTPVTSVLLDPDDGFVEQSKAMLIRDNKDFFLLRNTKKDRGYRIAYGVNLIGVRWKRDYSKLVTRIYPLAKDQDGDELPLPERFVDSERIGNYPFPMYESISISAQVGKDGETEETVYEKMREEAQKRFEEEEADIPSVTLSVDFLMLGDTEEYRQYKSLERVCLYDMVEVWHPDIGLTTSAQVKKYEWDVLEERLTRLELGKVFEKTKHTVAGYDLGDGCITGRKLSKEALDRIKEELG